MFRPSLSLLFLLLPLQAFAETKCYAPDGRVADDTYQPCIAIDGVHSMCCSLNTSAPDICQSNGLCLSNTNSTFKSNYWRDFCTDKTWDSPNCLSKTLCDHDAGGNSDWTSRVTLCTGGSYCCGTDQSCCSGTTFKLEPTLVSIGNNTTTTATVTATATGASDSGSSKVAIGAGVGVPLGILAMAMLGAGFFWGRRNTQAKYKALSGDGNSSGSYPDGYAQAHPLSEIHQANSKAIHEVSARSFGPSELPESGYPNQIEG
ncbi:unnamed protein product [Penicillium pancosmium]